MVKVIITITTVLMVKILVYNVGMMMELLGLGTVLLRWLILNTSETVVFKLVYSYGMKKLVLGELCAMTSIIMVTLLLSSK